MSEMKRIRPKSMTSTPISHSQKLPSYDSCPRYENEKEIYERQIKELRLQISQMEKTMRWWSDCTTNWREKWSKVKHERNELRDELNSLKTRTELVNGLKTGSGRVDFDRLHKIPHGNTAKPNTARKKTQTTDIIILDDETIANFEERITRLTYKLTESETIIIHEREEKHYLIEKIERLERNLYDLHELYENLKKELDNGREYYGESDSFAGCNSEIDDISENYRLRKDNERNTIEVNLPVIFNNNLKSETTIYQDGIEDTNRESFEIAQVEIQKNNDHGEKLQEYDNDSNLFSTSDTGINEEKTSESTHTQNNCDNSKGTEFKDSSLESEMETTESNLDSFEVENKQCLETETAKEECDSGHQQNPQLMQETTHTTLENLQIEESGSNFKNTDADKQPDLQNNVNTNSNSESKVSKDLENVMVSENILVKDAPNGPKEKVQDGAPQTAKNHSKIRTSDRSNGRVKSESQKRESKIPLKLNIVRNRSKSVGSV